jgi:tetratricopeptide (TPR) repeat protein
MAPSVTDAEWLQGKQVVLCGPLAAMSRGEAGRLVRACGGVIVAAIDRETDYLVMGRLSEPLAKDGRPIARLRRATQLQKQGARIQILDEEEFLTRCGLELPEHSVRHLYSEAHVCRILKISAERMTRWLRCGLVRPSQSKHQLAFFDFREVSWAKTLCNLTGRGTNPLAQLMLLEQNGRLLVRLENGSLAEPHGQPHLNFDEEPEKLAFETGPVRPSADEWFEQGVILEQEGNDPKAMEAYLQGLLTGGPDALACFNLANVLYRLGHKERAADRFRQAIEVDPGCAEAWNNLGNVLAELGDPAQALEALRQAVRLDPNCPSYQYNLADLLDEQGRPEEASRHWRSYLHGGEAGPRADHARRKIAASS